MNEIRVVPQLLAILLCASPQAGGSHLDARDTVDYSLKAPYTYGWINVQPPHGGNYQFGTQDSLRNEHPKYFMVGKPKRQDFYLLSAIEIEDVQHYRDVQLAAQRVAALAAHPIVISQRKPHKDILSGLAWPLIVVDGGNVCVPDLGHKDAPDWKDHLLCDNHGEPK